jgi:hypothetical protein
MSSKRKIFTGAKKSTALEVVENYVKNLGYANFNAID